MLPQCAAFALPHPTRFKARRYTGHFLGTWTRPGILLPPLRTFNAVYNLFWRFLGEKGPASGPRGLCSLHRADLPSPRCGGALSPSRVSPCMRLAALSPVASG